MSETLVPFTLTRPRRHEESSIQRAVVTFLRWALPDDAEYHAIPNGGWRWASEAKRMAGEGVRPGIPDLEVVHAGRAIYLELKTARGTLSSIQRQMHAKLQKCGAVVLTCRDVKSVADGLVEAGVRLRGRPT